MGRESLSRKIKLLRGTTLCMVATVLTVVGLLACGCLTIPIRPPPGQQAQIMTLEVTGYCNCGICCNWERSWFGLGPPIIASGPGKGQPKQVGLTASGAKAYRGTVAADTSLLPFGTIVQVPGYGYGKVMDRGGAIKGGKLDLWFPSHDEAKKWGRQTLKVKVWK